MCLLQNWLKIATDWLLCKLEIYYVHFKLMIKAQNDWVLQNETLNTVKAIIEVIKLRVSTFLSFLALISGRTCLMKRIVAYSINAA